MSNEVYLALGSNIGAREQVISEALHMLDTTIGERLCCSEFYYSRAWGYVSQNEFCNAIAIFKTELTPFDILRKTQQIELLLGRKEKTKNGEYRDRIIDIDLLKYLARGQEVRISTAELTLPHPQLVEREYIINPLTEVERKKNGKYLSDSGAPECGQIDAI